MTKKYFGTDGIRGAINSKHINGDMFFKFGLASGKYFKSQKKRKQIAVIAKDTRLSGYTLEPALVSGLTSAGMHVFTLGPLPTNGLAMLTKSMKANMGIMITASHNPHHDNGLKLFGPDGMKLSDKIEKKIEKLIDRKITTNLSSAEKLGRVKRLENGTKEYLKILKKNFPKEFNLRGLRIVIDCANGAGYRAGPELLKSLGAKVIAIGVKPNGMNINRNCGSTFPNKIKLAVKKNKAHLGISLDGDADRIIMSDELGNLIDRDQIIAAIASRWKNKRMLKGGVVGTLMSNYGIEKFFKSEKIKFIRANVGDRYVKEKMQKNNYNLGGEQSGHIVMTDYSTTGDGLMAGLQFVAEMVRTGRRASELARTFDPVPQLLQNVRFGAGQTPLDMDPVRAAIAQAEADLQHNGRLLIRKSGTEPLIRVMAECEDSSLLQRVVGDVVTAIEQVTS